MTIKAKYTHEWKNAQGEKQQLKVEAKSYAEAFRQFWTHFMTTDLHYTIETIENALIRTSESEYFVAVNGQKKKNIPVAENLYVYTHLTPKAMEKAYEKFLKHWNNEVTEEPQETAPVTASDEEQTVEEIHKEIDEILAQPEPTEPEAPAEPEAEVKKLSPREEKKLKTAAILAAQREDKRKKKEAAEARKRAKLEAQQQQESQEELDLPNI